MRKTKEILRQKWALQRAHRAIENAGARLVYLPPYSPELNPIEPYWSAFKKPLRRLEARTVDAHFAAIDRVRRWRISTRRMFAHCCYA